MMKKAEQHAEPGTVAKVAVRIDSIRAIAQVAGAFEVLGVPTEPPFHAALDQPEWIVVEKSESALVLHGHFIFRGEQDVKKNDRVEREPFFAARASFQIDYALTSGEKFSDSDVQAFARLNGQLNLHPYWREFVHSALTRSSMPPFLLPPFNPFKAAVDKKQAEGAKAAENSDSRGATKSP